MSLWLVEPLLSLVAFVSQCLLGRVFPGPFFPGLGTPADTNQGIVGRPGNSGHTHRVSVYPVPSTLSALP